MFDTDITREMYGGMMASVIISVAAMIGAAMLYWWVTTRG